MTKKVKFVLDIDDIHPQRGYGYKDEYHERLMKLLELGVRPTYFIVPKWQGKEEYNIVNHKKWVESLGRNVEFAVHGLTHFTTEPVALDQKHLEFFHLRDLESVSKVRDAVSLIKKVTGQVPKLLRFPGWLATLEQAKSIMESVKCLKGIADNFVGGTVVERFGLLNVPYTCLLGKGFNQEDDVIVCHAHVSEGGFGRNENGLSEENFGRLVEFLKKNEGCLEFVTMSEAFEL